ncbi:MAG: hypothetical protein ABSE20_04990 [Acetobacteraceae bacterium]
MLGAAPQVKLPKANNASAVQYAPRAPSRPASAGAQTEDMMAPTIASVVLQAKYATPPTSATADGRMVETI